MSDERQPYDPNSPDSMFSRIMLRLDTIDETTKRTEAQAKLTNGRVTCLEREKWLQRGVVLGISGVVSFIGYIITIRNG